MTRRAIATERITGPNGEEVVVRFYEDRAIRLEVKGGPWAIGQAWLPGGEGANILLRSDAPEEDMEPALTDMTVTPDTTGT